MRRLARVLVAGVVSALSVAPADGQPAPQPKQVRTLTSRFGRTDPPPTSRSGGPTWWQRLPRPIVPLALAGAGLISTAAAVVFERRMQRHRQPGVSYRDVTLRKDGGWRRADLFTPEGLELQRRAARFGWLGAGLWILALAAWAALQFIE